MAYPSKGPGALCVCRRRAGGRAGGEELEGRRRKVWELAGRRSGGKEPDGEPRRAVRWVDSGLMGREKSPPPQPEPRTLPAAAADRQKWDLCLFPVQATEGQPGPASPSSATHHSPGAWARGEGPGSRVGSGGQGPEGGAGQREEGMPS